MVWSLDSVVERHNESPYTFYVPSKYVLDQLGEGDLVKLIFMSDQEDQEYSGERMWVEITKRQGGFFNGRLQNEPIYINSLLLGDEINFKVENICDTLLTDPSLINWDYYFEKKVIVSNDVLKRNNFNFLLRDKSENDADTGWVFFSGYEVDGFNEDSNNFQYISIGKMLNVDDSILSFIDTEPYCAFERDLESNAFYEVKDYNWDNYLKE